MANIANASSAYVSDGKGNAYPLTNNTLYGYYTVYTTVYPFKINYAGNTAQATFYNQSNTIYVPFKNISNVKLILSGNDMSSTAYVVDQVSGQGTYTSIVSINNPNPGYVNNLTGWITLSFNYQSTLL